MIVKIYFVEVVVTRFGVTVVVGVIVTAGLVTVPGGSVVGKTLVVVVVEFTTGTVVSGIVTVGVYYLTLETN